MVTSFAHKVESTNRTTVKLRFLVHQLINEHFLLLIHHSGDCRSSNLWIKLGSIMEFSREETTPHSENTLQKLRNFDPLLVCCLGSSRGLVSCPCRGHGRTVRDLSILFCFFWILAWSMIPIGDSFNPDTKIVLHACPISDMSTMSATISWNLGQLLSMDNRIQCSYTIAKGSSTVGASSHP